MSDGASLINLGELSKPATVLIEKISEAIGGLYHPYQIRRVAKAEADAELIKAQTQIEITELQRRALTRFINEEAQRQANIENITQKAIPLLSESSSPQQIENDWIVNFFDKCRIISDEEMQSLWAQILAGESNTPGTYSKRTVNFLSTLDKSEADLFTSLCRFCWKMKEDVQPFIYDISSTIYSSNGISFSELSHLTDIGLINFDNITIFSLISLPKQYNLTYHGELLTIDFADPENNTLDVGSVILTKVGQQLANLCIAKPIDGFYTYVSNALTARGYKVQGADSNTNK